MLVYITNRKLTNVPVTSPAFNYLREIGDKLNMKAKLPYFIFFCSVIFLIDVFLIHFIKPELDWVASTLSWYAIGDSGYIINAGFYLFAAAEVACAVLLVLNIRHSIIYSPLSFLLAGAGALLVAVFPVQPPAVDLASRLPHIMGAIMQFMFFPLALIGIKDTIQDGRLKIYTRLTAYITLVFFVILLSLLILRSRFEFPFFGLLQKIDILLITLWMVVFSFVSIGLNIFRVEK